MRDQDDRVQTLMMGSCFAFAQEVDVIRSCQEKMQQYRDQAKAQLA